MGVARISFRGGDTFSKNIQKILKDFQNFSKNFLTFSKNFQKKFVKKIAKNGVFLAYFSKNLTNPAFNFCAFGRKTLCAGNC